MLRQLIGPSKRSLAHVALELLCPGMQFHVLHEVVPSTEAFRANVTEMRFVVAVRCHVALQMVAA